MRKIFIALNIFLAGLPAFSQQKLLTIEEAVLGRRQFNPEDMVNIKWRDNQRFTYVENYAEIIQLNVSNGDKKSIIKTEGLNSLLEKNKLPKLQYLYDYSWLDENTLAFENGNSYFTFLPDQNKIGTSLIFPENAENMKVCGSNQYVAFTIDNNLYFQNQNGKTEQITHDDKGIVNGNPYVHRQEFGIDNGIFWSPKGNYIAFYRKDETMVADYPIVDITSRIASLKNTKYPMAGETSEHVTLGIYDLKSGKTLFLKTGEPKDHYLTRITWDPTEKFIFIAELNRDQNHMKLNKYDALTGDFVQTLFEEKNPRYVEPENDLIFLKTKPSQFVWFSERDGFKHLYLYDTSGKLIKQLTSGTFVITDFIGFDEKDLNFYVMSTMESPIERHLYKYNIKTGKAIRLTAQQGTHLALLSPDFKYFIDKNSSIDIPRNIKLYETSGKEIRELLIAKNPLKDYKLGEMNIGTLKAADEKTDLYYRMVKPADFDPNKKYPVIVYVYGGPHSQLVYNTWLGGGRLYDQYMAGKGYILFTLDNRGTDYRGFEFESIIHRQLGVEEMKDQMKGIELLKSLPYVDKERIGVEGWSYGGFMTISLMLSFPETFKVGTAGGPVIDWKYYEVMYGERYMDTPQENEDGYANTSLLAKAKNLKGRLLIIHGAVDNTVVWQNSQAFLKSCIDNGVLLDYFVYPTHEHNVSGKDRLHLMKKISQYYDDFLY